MTRGLETAPTTREIWIRPWAPPLVSVEHAVTLSSREDSYRLAAFEQIGELPYSSCRVSAQESAQLCGIGNLQA